MFPKVPILTLALETYQGSVESCKNYQVCQTDRQSSKEHLGLQPLVYLTHRRPGWSVLHAINTVLMVCTLQK